MADHGAKAMLYDALAESAKALANGRRAELVDVLAQAVTQRLTIIIGPIARVVAKRAARQTGDRIEFLQLLAAHIDSAPERTRFLSEAGAA